MKMPKISIIIPNYNNSKYLSDCLASVRCQTFSDFECIIVDDVSTDDSVVVIRKLIADDNRFRLIVHEKNMGVSVARNTGIDAARGQYFAFLDSDDCYTPIALESMFLAAKKTGADLVNGAAVTVPDNFKFEKKLPKKLTVNKAQPIMISDGHENVLRNFCTSYNVFGENYKNVWIWHQLFHRDIIERVRFVPGLCPGDDICFILDVFQYVNKLVMIWAPITYHRLSSTSVMNNGLSAGQIDFFLPTLEYIRDNVVNKYPAWFIDSFFYSFAGYFFDYMLLVPLHQRMCRNVAGNTLKEIIRRNLFPKKYFGRFQWLLLRLMAFAYSSKKGEKHDKTKNISDHTNL